MKQGAWSERPEDVIKLIAKYAKSPMVNRYLNNYPRKFEERFQSGELDRFKVRDFLMISLVCFGGGNRSDVVRGMTLGEWRSAKFQNVGDKQVRNHLSGSSTYLA